MKHIMLDLETLDVNASSAIVSIGAIRFDPYSPGGEKTFYVVMNLEEQMHKLNRSLSLDTIKWWLTKTSDNARSVFTQEASSNVAEICDAFIEFCRGSNYLWAKGPSFDNIILRSLFVVIGKTFPFHYSADRDVRTILDIRYEVFPDLADLPVDNMIEHNALEDAKYQVRQVQQTLNLLKAA